jgi:hypothetical protein
MVLPAAGSGPAASESDDNRVDLDVTIVAGTFIENVSKRR